jgi:hypothetical protein
MITLEMFLLKVTAMREAQINYFKHRSNYYLNTAKALEKEVDAMIKKMGGEQKPPVSTQSGLFNY